MDEGKSFRKDKQLAAELKHMRDTKGWKQLQQEIMRRRKDQIEQMYVADVNEIARIQGRLVESREILGWINSRISLGESAKELLTEYNPEDGIH